MSGLERWAKALEKWGVPFVYEHDDRPGWQAIVIGAGTDEYAQLTGLSDHHSAAEFISRVTEHCFGPWAWFEPTYDVLGNPAGWTVRTPIVIIETCDGVRIHNHLGFGPKKLGALLDALERNELKGVQK